ncbi:MAG: hypothetical protein ACQGTM_11810 [bacterium]
MRELGLAALAHANRHAAYYDPENPRWSDLSILQAAHAAEIIIKARIAQEHPLLVFDEFPKLPKGEGSPLTVQNLFEKGKTIQWSDLPTRLWATTGIKIPNQDKFYNFGKLRNGVQHFSLLPSGNDTSKITLEFVFDVIDPFINECWGLFAIDFDEDYDSYENFPLTLIRNEIPFLVSPDAAKHRDTWNDNLENANVKYKEIMLERIREAANTER